MAVEGAHGGTLVDGEGEGEAISGNKWQSAAISGNQGAHGGALVDGEGEGEVGR